LGGRSPQTELWALKSVSFENKGGWDKKALIDYNFLDKK